MEREDPDRKSQDEIMFACGLEQVYPLQMGLQ